MASKNYYLVDTENVGTSWKHLLADKTNRDEIFIFYTDNSPYISYTDMCEIIQYPNSFKTIKCYTGRDALDFQLDSYLGFLLRSAPKANYFIISNDNGYESICRFWGDQGYSVFRKTAAELISEHTTIKEESIEENIASPSSNTDTVEATELESSANLTNSASSDSLFDDAIESKIATACSDNAKSSKKRTSQPGNHKPKKYSKESSKTPSAIAVYIPEKYRNEQGLENKLMVIVENSDINKLQPLYNTFVKQFGQAKGLDLYKSIKSHLKDIKKELSATNK